jgi:hypothetical protein
MSICPLWNAELTADPGSRWSPVHRKCNDDSLYMDEDPQGEYVVGWNGVEQKYDPSMEAYGNYNRCKNSGKLIRYSPVEFTLDTHTGKVYRSEPQWVVAIKCAEIALGTIVYVLGAMAWNTVKIAVDIVLLARKIISKVSSEIALGRSGAACHIVIQAVIWKLPRSVVEDIRRIVSAPIFGLGVELAALYGIFSPYEGRELIAKIEYAWHDGKTFRDDVRNHNRRWTCSLKDLFQERVLFLGWCFQVRGTIKDTIGDSGQSRFISPI